MTITEVVEKLIEKVELPSVISYEAKVKYDLPKLQSKLNIHFKFPVEKKKNIDLQELDEQVLSYIGFYMVFDEDKLNIEDWLDKCKKLIDGLGMRGAFLDVSLKKFGRKDFVYVPEDEQEKISKKVNCYYGIEELTAAALEFSKSGKVKGYNLSPLPRYKKTFYNGGYINWLRFNQFLFNLKIVGTKDAIINHYAPILDKILS